MFQERNKVYKDCPQELLYTFKNSKTKQPIPLDGYAEVKLHAKVQGAAPVTPVTAQFVDKPAGTVRLASYTFTTVGVWAVHFVCDGTLKGEIAEITVVPNVADLATDQLPDY